MFTRFLRAVGLTRHRPPKQQQQPGATPPAGAMQNRQDEPASERFRRLADDLAASDAALGEARPVGERFPGVGEAAAATTSPPAGEKEGGEAGRAGRG